MFEAKLLDIAELVSDISSDGLADELRKVLEGNILTPHLILDLQIRQPLSVWWWLIGCCLLHLEDPAYEEIIIRVKESFQEKVLSKFEMDKSLSSTLTSVELMALLMADAMVKKGEGEGLLNLPSSAAELKSLLIYPNELWKMMSHASGEREGTTEDCSGPFAHLSLNWPETQVDNRMTYSTLISMILLKVRAEGRRRRRRGSVRLGLSEMQSILSEERVIDEYRDSLIRLLLSCYCPEQKCFSGSPFGEPHAGYVYCTLGSLLLLNVELYAKGEFEEKFENTRIWLLGRLPKDQRRKLCNGRSGKEGDVCYCFWVVASLKMLNHHSISEAQKDLLKTGLQECQRSGGLFSKAKDQPPDIFHTYFAQIALKLITNPQDVNLFLGILHSMI